MKFAGWYSLFVGVLMLGQWGFFLAAGQVPEVKTEPVRLAFHLAAEFITALGLIVGGVALLKRRPWATTVYLVASGMLLYSIVVSPGYFAQQGQWALVGMFGALLILALAGIWSATRSRSN